MSCRSNVDLHVARDLEHVTQFRRISAQATARIRLIGEAKVGRDGGEVEIYPSIDES
jgi:hypothetical protein